jgi:hypothetical protein
LIASISDLISFLKFFHRDLRDDPTLDPALIPGDLPHGLAMIYRELGALVEVEPGRENEWRAPFAAQDALLPVGHLKRIDGMVEFAWENQGNWSARYPVDLPDPPVYSNAPDLWGTVRRGFVRVCDSLDHFLTTLCLQEAVMGCRNLASLETDQPPDRVLTMPLQPLWLNGHYVSGEPDHQFFVSRERDVLVMDWAGIWVASPVHQVADLVVPGVMVQEIH